MNNNICTDVTDDSTRPTVLATDPESQIEPIQTHKLNNP
jgi:hypothetical protein